MAPPWKSEDYRKQYEGVDQKWVEETYLKHPDLFVDLPGPKSIAAAPTLNESTTAQKRPSGGEANTDNKKPKIASTATGEASLPITTDVEMPLTGTGKEMADIGGESDGMVYQIHRPLSIFGAKESTYRKSHKFMTFGLAPNVLTTGDSIATAFISTYLAEVPWHIPALYLNPSEFALLSNGSRCVSIDVEVYYRGTTIQFETATSTSGLATLNQINDIAVAHALNKSGQGSNISFTQFQTGNTMLPTGFTRPKYDTVGTTYRGMVQDYYGVDNASTDYANFVPHHQVGRQTFLYNYWAQSSIQILGTSSNAARQYGGWPTLADKIIQYDGKTMVNQCVAKSQYTPKMGMLKAPLKNNNHGLPNPNSTTSLFSVTCGAHLPNQRTVNLTPVLPSASGGAPLSSSESGIGMTNNNTFTYNIYSPIEKSQFTRSGNWGEQDPHIQPSLHIGVQPIPALTTSATLTSNTGDNPWTDTRAYWEIVATMKVVEQLPTAYPYSTIANVPPGEVVYTNSSNHIPLVNTDPRDDGATWQGLYTYATPVLPADI